MSPKHGMAYEALCALNRNALQISIYLTYCSYSENNNSITQSKTFVSRHTARARITLMMNWT